ncbi:MAG: hypothetical protein EBY45_09540 [Gammaproteobacteria bacterium]|nr:hypothetical protein [Gammaproteobacteria bacterium]
MISNGSGYPQVQHSMRHFIIFERTLVIGLESGSSRPLIAQFAIGGDKKAAQDQPRGAVPFFGVVTGDMVEIAKEKAAKVDTGTFSGARGGCNREAEKPKDQLSPEACPASDCVFLH